MDYKEALAYLFTPKENNTWENRSNYTEALKRLGNPQNGQHYIHVAGTNGKGSVCAYLFSVLKECGYRVGLFTSPHIHRFPERIRVNEHEISEEDAACLITKVKEVNEEIIADGYSSLRIFEMITIVGFLYFLQMNCDIVLLEVGLGGRLDATNCILPQDTLISVITTIGLDHEEFLGHNLVSIAAEKAGIIKDNGYVVALKQNDEIIQLIQNRCAAKKAELILCDSSKICHLFSDLNGSRFDFEEWKHIEISLLGSYEVINACIALTVCTKLMNKKIYPLDETKIRSGMRKAKWGGRCELLNRKPPVIADGCHNSQGIKAFLQSASALLPDFNLTIIFGVLADKNLSDSYPLLHQYGKKILLTTPPSQRALPAEELLKEIQNYGKASVKAVSSMEEALQTAMLEADDKTAILVMGSLYQIASVREYFGRKDFYQ